MLIEGDRLLEAALDAGVRFEEIFCTESWLSGERGADIARRSCRAGGAILMVSPSLLGRLAGTKSPQGAVATAPMPPTGRRAIEEALTRSTESAERIILVWVGALQDPGNLGTIIRTAHALAVGGLLISPGAVDPFGPKALRASAGASFSLPLVLDVSYGASHSWPALDGFLHIAAVPRHGLPLWDLDPPEKALVLVGQEAHGLECPVEDRAHIKVTIPMLPAAESLNVAGAAAIILAHLTPLRRR